MSTQNPLQSRLKELDLNYNKLAVRVAEADPEGRDPMALYTTVRRAVLNPDNVKLDTLRRVVTALGGELVIKWPATEAGEVKL